MIKAWNSLPNFIRFGIIGGAGFVVEITSFNVWIILTDGGPLIANVFSVLLAIMFNWAGNHFMNFEKNKNKGIIKEIFQFFVASGAVAIPLSTIMLAVSYYGLGQEDILITNIIKVFAIIVSAYAKFILYKKWVFKGS
jgi:putative flippase GtrA